MNTWSAQITIPPMFRGTSRTRAWRIAAFPLLTPSMAERILSQESMSRVPGSFEEWLTSSDARELTGPLRES